MASPAVNELKTVGKQQGNYKFTKDFGAQKRRHFCELFAVTKKAQLAGLHSYVYPSTYYEYFPALLITTVNLLRQNT